MRKFLEDLIARYQKQIIDMEAAITESDDREERAAMTSTLAEIRNQLSSAEAALAALEDDNPANRRGAGFNPQAMMVNNTDTDAADATCTTQYRTAFMNYVIAGTPIPAELRANENTLTGDVVSVIPTNLVNRIIERMDECGMILPLFTHTSFKGAIGIPTSNVKPVATWVNEGQGSERQKKTTGIITFAYHKLRCEISMSAEVGAMALAVFESKFIDNVAKAMVIAQERACLIDGDGTTQPKGILTETPEAGKAVSVAKSGKLDWKFLCQAEALVPTEYENSAMWFMTKTTFMKFMEMTDANGQPVARMNVGLNGRMERSLLGRTVVINPYMENYVDAPTADTKFAMIVDPSDYIFNTIYDLGISRKQDWDTEDHLTKAVMSCDGKLVDKTSLIVFTKTAA